MASVFEEALCQTLKKCHINYSLKTTQVDILQHLTQQSTDVIALLPTGYGKSDLFMLYPVLKELLSGKPSKVLIICPLKSLICDQVQRARVRGIAAYGLRPQSEMTMDDITGDYIYKFILH